MSLKFEVRIRHNSGPHGLKYMRHGKPHRNNSPAKVWDDGVIFYYRYGKWYIS